MKGNLLKIRKWVQVDIVGGHRDTVSTAASHLAFKVTYLDALGGKDCEVKVGAG